MGRMILVTGGARSGKSTFAEETVSGFGENILYIATSVPFDDEMKLRVQKHREQRPSHWETLEAYKDFGEKINEVIKGKNAVILDCITIMVTNIMYESSVDWDSLNKENVFQIEEEVRNEVHKLINAVKSASVPFVIVTNEVGMGIVPENAITRLFRDIAGRINQILAREADEVFLCVSGIPIRIKG